MSKKLWRYTLTAQEQKLWDTEEMQGWRKAMQACVEDEAREQGCSKFIMYDHKEVIIAKDNVTKLPEPQVVT